MGRGGGSGTPKGRGGGGGGSPEGGGGGGERVTGTYYHATSAAGAASIHERGIDVEAGTRGILGQGFYLSKTPHPDFGEVVVPVRVQLKNAIVGTRREVNAKIDEIAGRAATDAEVRSALVRAGHDGLVVRRPDGNDYVVLLKPGAGKVAKSKA
jgi:hypothetical protein